MNFYDDERMIIEDFQNKKRYQWRINRYARKPPRFL